MKQIFTLFTAAFLMLIAFNAKAQDNKISDEASDDDGTIKLKSYISLSAGVSNPYGNFKKVDYTNMKSGFGKKGLVYAIDGAAYFYKNLGLGYTVSYQDQGNLSFEDVQIISTGYTADFKADGSTVTADKRYRSINALLGPQYSLAWKALRFDFRASAGIIKSFATPQISVDITGVPEQAGTFIQQSSKAIAFAYGGSIAMRLSTGAGWGLFVKGNYINSDGPKLTTTGRTSTLGRTLTHQPITEGQLTLGLYKEFK